MFSPIRRPEGGIGISGTPSAKLVRAGISDFRWHDLRHTFASWHVQGGTDLYRLSRMLGHSTLQMSARYAHWPPNTSMRRSGTWLHPWLRQ